MWFAVTISKLAELGITDDAQLRSLALRFADYRMTRENIAKALGVSVAKVRELVCANDLPRIVGLTLVQLRDLRTTLVHEHGHRIVAAHYRVPGRISVRFNSDGSDLAERYFKGQFHSRGRMPTPRSARLVGLAGAVANLIDDEPEIDLCEIDDRLDDDKNNGMGIFSETDRQLAVGYTWYDVAGTLKLLRRYWSALTVAVDRDFLAVQGFA